MAAVTPTVTKEAIVRAGQTTRLVRESGTSAADSADTFTTTLDRPKKLLGVNIVYSAAPTYTAALTCNLDSALGAAFDVTALFTIGTADNDQFAVWYPAVSVAAAETGGTYLGPDLIFAGGDQLVFNLPAAGGVITSSIVVYWEQLR
jgi:hypothetical protein